jgi:hypothetical protein
MSAAREPASESPCNRQSGMYCLRIFAFRTLKAAIIAGVFTVSRLFGSFHIAHSFTRPLKWFARKSTQRSHSFKPSGVLGMPSESPAPPAPG